MAISRSTAILQIAADRGAAPAWLNVREPRRILTIAFGLLVLPLGFVHCTHLRADDKTVPSDASKTEWIKLPTDDRELWTASQFGGDGDVTFDAAAIRMTSGDPITGVRCLAKLPRENYEIELEARRTSNFDFFCGLTFPVGPEGKCSLIVGGWAGAVVGLSSVDGEDAARNPTKRLMNFDNNTWYKIRVRVDSEAILCWIDEKQVVKQPREGHTFDIRAEMYESLPLGIAAFMCDSEIRNVRWRPIEQK
jgi:hypothetical protein